MYVPYVPVCPIEMREDSLIKDQALRGAADSFGIVTSFYLATKPAPTTITEWSILLPDMYSSAAKAASAFLNIQKFALNAAVVDRKITFRFFLDGNIFVVDGLYLGSADTFNKTVCDFSFQASGAKRQSSHALPIGQTGQRAHSHKGDLHSCTVLCIGCLGGNNLL